MGRYDGLDGCVHRRVLKEWPWKESIIPCRRQSPRVTRWGSLYIRLLRGVLFLDLDNKLTHQSSSSTEIPPPINTDFPPSDPPSVPAPPISNLPSHSPGNPSFTPSTTSNDTPLPTTRSPRPRDNSTSLSPAPSDFKPSTPPAPRLYDSVVVRSPLPSPPVSSAPSAALGRGKGTEEDTSTVEEEEESVGSVFEGDSEMGEESVGEKGRGAGAGKSIRSLDYLRHRGRGRGYHGFRETLEDSSWQAQEVGGISIPKTTTREAWFHAKSRWRRKDGRKRNILDYGT